MKIEKQNLENHEVKLNVQLDKEEFGPYLNKAAKKIASSQRIPGFRPGKAPANVILNMFGEAAVAQEAFDLFLEDGYSKILSQAEVEPGAMGRLEAVEAINPPSFDLVIPLKATVDLGDYRSIREDYQVEELTDAEVEEALEELKRPYAEQVPAEGEIVDGQFVYAMIKGELDEPLEEGGTTEFVKEMPHDFLVGDDSDPDSAWPYPEFTKCLLGHKEGDVVVSEYTYPDDSVMSALKGHKATFTAAIQSVKNRVMPENTDDFAKNFGPYDSFDALMADLKKNLADRKAKNEENKYIEAVVKKMSEMAKVEVSATEIQEAINDRLAEIKENIQQRGVGFDAWLKMKKMSESEFVEKELKDEVVKQVERKHILSEFASAEKISLNFEKFQEKVNEMMSGAQTYIEGLKNKKERENVMNNIRENALNEAYLADVFGRLTAIAKGENPAIESAEEAGAKAAAVAGEEAAAEEEAKAEA